MKTARSKKSMPVGSMVPATVKGRAEEGDIVAGDHRDLPAGNDLVHPELPVQVFFEPGLDGKVRLRIEGHEEHVHVETAGEARRFDERAAEWRS